VSDQRLRSAGISRLLLAISSGRRRSIANAAALHETGRRIARDWPS
jgi:hypothetical protein